MKQLRLKNVVGSKETASKLPMDSFEMFARLRLPIGKIMPSRWSPPTGYSLKKMNVGNVPIECITSESKNNHKIILDLHGGGFVLGLSDLLRAEALMLAKVSEGAMVVSVEYRLAPKDKYPAALEDCLTVYKWLLESGYQAEDIIIVGGSAGGGLAASLTLYARDKGLSLPKGVILMSPWGDLTTEASSREVNFEIDPVLGKYGTQIRNEIYNSSYVGDNNPKDPYISPVFGEYTNFPNTLIQVGTLEVLYDDAINIYDKIEAAGGKVKLTSYYGMWHCFQQTTEIAESKIAWADIGKFMKECFEA